MLSHIHASRNGLLLEREFLTYQNTTSHILHPSKRIPVLRICILTGFSFSVHYCSSSCLTYTSHDFNLHSCGSSIVKKMLLMSSNHCSNITTLIKNKAKQLLNVLLVQAKPFCLLLSFQPVGKHWF